VRKILIIIVMMLFAFSVPVSAQMFDDGTKIQEGKKEEQKVEKRDLLGGIQRGRIFQGDAYYYDKEKNKTYPQFSTKKFAVMFDISLDKKDILGLAKIHPDIINAYVLEITNLDFSCVVFELDEKSDRDVFDFIGLFNNLKIAKFASPIFIIDGKEHVFTGLFEMKVKENPDDPGQMDNNKTIYGMISLVSEVTRRDQIKGMPKCYTYSIELKENGRNFFQIINFFAEDPRVVYAVPVLTRITPLVEIVQEVELKGARLGSRIPYKITIRKGPKVKIDPSVLTNLKISQTHMIHKLDPYDPNNIIEGTEIVITGYVQFFVVGEQVIEPRKVSYLLEENGKTVKGEVLSNQLVIKIASLVPENSEDGIIAKAPFKKYSAEKVISELKANRNIAITFALASIILCLVAIVKFSIWLAGDMKIRKGKETINPLPKAVEALKDAISSTKDYGYAKRIDIAVRNWLSVKTGSDFRTGTVSHIQARLELLDAGFAEDVSKALEKCEEIMSREESDSQIQNLTLELEEITSKLV
jgi:hypothetical protein